MNWIEQNKTASAIMGATIVVSGVLVFLGMGANSDAQMARAKQATSVKKINTLQAAIPYPSKENEQKLAENLAMFAADTKKFQDTMLTFRPVEMEKLSANEFNAEVSAYTSQLTTYYQSKKIALPPKKKPYFGMELYGSQMAKEEDTSYLNYNRQALEWFFTVLADSGIDALHNVYRAPEAEKLNKKSEPVAQPARPQRGAARTNAKTPAPVAIESVYDGLPIEITFTGTEASLEKFIADVAAGEEYFFALRYMKVINDEQDPVVISKATFPPAAAAPETAPVEGAEGQPFEGVEINPEADSGFEEGLFGAPEDKEIIKQVIGDEKITVFLMFELLFFKEEASVKIPRLVGESPEAGLTK